MKKTHPGQMSFFSLGSGQVVLSQSIEKQINNFGESKATESRTQTVPAKYTATQKRALEGLSQETGIPVGKLGYMATEMFCTFFRHYDKMMKHPDAMLSMLQLMKD